MTEEVAKIDRLIAASSLGTPEAVALRGSVSDEAAARCVARSYEIGADEHVEQPMPTPNDRPSVQGMVRADLEVRERVGIQRYGTPLQTGNGRDALRDAYEEAMDLTVYLRQVIAERDLAAAAPSNPRAAVLMWDYRQQPDLEKLARVVTALSGGRVHLREVDTGGQEIALLVSDTALSGEAAAGVFDGWYLRQVGIPEVFDVEVSQ